MTALQQPIDAVLKAHIVIQSVTFAILLPVGVTLGLSRSRWHVPLQSLAVLLAFAGAALGRWHRGRPFRVTLHAQLSSVVLLYITLHAAAAAASWSRLRKGRAWITQCHRCMGLGALVVAWIQVLLGVTAALGFCFNDEAPEDHMGQCIAHFSMGSAFVFVGFSQIVLVRLGTSSSTYTGLKPDAIDSLVIGIWGIINTFTEHGVFFSAGSRWSHKDQQHTSMGIFWLCGGLLGFFLSLQHPKRRNVIPGFIICVTGWVFGSHEQSLHFSTVVHQVFGTTLFLAGLARIIEVCLVHQSTEAWKHVMPLLLTTSGICFMTANEEQLSWMVNESIGNTQFAIWQYTLAMVLYAYANILMELYIRTTKQLPHDLRIRNVHGQQVIVFNQ